MKKMIGVIALLLTLALTALYRQLTAHPARACRPRLSVPSVAQKVQENMILASLLIQ
jgi:hypothetical protein